MTQIRTDIAVVGAGIAGLATSAALARAGFKVALIHRGPALRDLRADFDSRAESFDARVYALSPESRALLESVDAWQALAGARVAPVFDMRVYPQAGLGPGAATELHLSAYEGRSEALAWIGEQSNVLNALAQCQPKKVREVVGELNGIRHSTDGRAVLVDVGDGITVRAALLVGADGASSPVRAHAGIAQQGTSYEQSAIVTHLEGQGGHRDTAWQWFGSHGILAMLPMPDAVDTTVFGGLRTSLVWSCATEQADQLLSDGPAALCTSIEAVTGGLFGSLRTLSAPVSFPLARRWAETVVGDRIVLVGDAAHVMHPLAGQGLNTGLADVAALASVLGSARDQFLGSGFDPGQDLLLRRYRRQRAEPVSTMMTVTDGLKRAFCDLGASVRTRPLQWIRDAGWQAFARQPLLRRQLLRHAIRPN